MTLAGFPILTVVIFLPVLGAIPIVFFPREEPLLTRTWALLVTLVEFLVSLGLIAGFDPAAAGMQLVERVPWIPGFGIQYYLGLDGISLAMVLLTTFLSAVAVIASWRDMGVVSRAKEYAVFLLLLEAGLVGSFLALDLVLFFAFWEAMLVPAYLLVGTCGGTRRIYAAYKFFLYTAFGSLLMLVGIIVVFAVNVQRGAAPTFDALTLAQSPVPAGMQLWVFLLFALAFGIKVPIWPLHTWLPDLYYEMPLGAMVLVTTMAKVGAYGFLRFAIPLFPSAALYYAPLLAVLGLVGILYGAVSAFVQRDLVLVIAYSSIAHLGFIVLGIFTLNHQSVQGAVVQMVNHGLSAGALFLIAAALYARVGSTSFERLGGASARWPVMGGFALVAMLSSVGLPGLNGFVGEFLIVYGAFSHSTAYALIAALGIILAAVYLTRMYRLAFHGPIAPSLVGPDLVGREVLALVPMVVLIVAIGVYPLPLLSGLEQGVGHVTAPLQTALASPSLQEANHSATNTAAGG
jgi:NADH-quinone oxidoreductase subunit M